MAFKELPAFFFLGRNDLAETDNELGRNDVSPRSLNIKGHQGERRIAEVRRLGDGDNFKSLEFTVFFSNIRNCLVYHNPTMFQMYIQLNIFVNIAIFTIFLGHTRHADFVIN